MSILDMNFLRTGFMKKAKFAVSSTQRAQANILISETGIISREVLPMETGYESAPAAKMSWLVLHSLKLSVRNKYGEIENDPILLISERNYLPLDPLEKLSATDRKKIVSLLDVAEVKHDEVMASLSEEGQDNPRDKMLISVSNIGMVIIGILAVASFILRMWGNG